MSKNAVPDQTVCRNRKALYRFEILEKLECGIMLRGTEVKSLREKNASIEEAYARIDGDELWLIGAHVAQYKFGHTQSHEPLRRRKLLAHTTEIRKLKHKVDQKGFTLVPLAVYFNNRGIAKVSLGLVRGKKFADKRRDLQTREHQREIDRGMRRKK
jgi:SsrA-binding protein